jgi:cytidylate kinase
MTGSPRVIAIDGPAGAGKSTVARLVAARSGLPYLDTGAMYRCVALACIRSGIDPADAAATGARAAGLDISVEPGTVFLDGRDVTDEVRTPEVAATVSVIAAHSAVRDTMRALQREWIVRHGGGVVEGRDIGTVVFPDALLKVFLDASPVVRARRRVLQEGGDVDEVASSIAERDRIDSSRSDSPLRPAPDAFHVDSSERSVDEVVAAIVDRWWSVSNGTGGPGSGSA